MDFEQTIPFLFARISTAYKINLEKQMNEINLHGGQVFILFELWKTDGQSQISLAKNLNISPPTVNKMVKSLMTGGFVSCDKCKTDGRLFRVFLTPKGFDIRPQVEEKWKLIEEQLAANLTETEKLVLFQLFDRIKNNLF